MRILLVMESWDAQTGSYETPCAAVRSVLQRLGHEVAVVDHKRNRLPCGGRTVWEYGPLLRRLRAARLNDRLAERQILAVARRLRPERILVFRGENLRWPCVRRLRLESGARLLNWNHDNPFWPDNTSLHHLRAIPLFHVYGAFARHFLPVLASLGAPHPVHVPMFFAPERFGETVPDAPAPDPAFRSDVAFVGNGSPERAALLRPLAAQPDIELAVWGHWPLLSPDDPLRRCVRESSLDTAGYIAAMRGTRIGVNVLNRQCQGASNTRTFEVPGLGRLLLTEYSREQAEELFLEDREIACFRTPEDLCAKVRHYLRDADARERVAAAGRRRVLAEHTLEHRLCRLLAAAEAP